MIELELAAVIVPSLRNAGRSDGILSSFALRGPSSLSTTVSPPRPLTVTGAISSANAPLAAAACARLTDVVAKWSCCSRVNAYCVAQSSPNVPIERRVPSGAISYASSRPSIIM